MSYHPPQYANYQQPPRADARSRLNGPAIGMIVAAILSMLSSFIGLAYGVFIYAMVDQVPDLIEQERQRSGQQMTPQELEQTKQAEEFLGTIGKGYAIFFLVLGVLSMALGIVVLFGAMQMMKAKMYGLCITSAVLCLLPFGGCWLVSLPMGIWALVVLMDAHVKQTFR